MMQDIQQVVFDTLANSSDLTTLIGSGKISYKIAPSDAQFPYVVFYEVSERFTNTHKQDECDLWFSVRIMDTDNAVTQEAAALIRDLFHNQILVISGWNVYRSKFLTQSTFLEQVERVQVYKRTLDFRLTMNQ